MVHKYPVAREAKRKASQRERERERASVLAHEPVRRYFRSIRSLPAALPTAAAHKRNGGKGEGQRGETGDGPGGEEMAATSMSTFTFAAEQLPFLSPRSHVAHPPFGLKRKPPTAYHGKAKSIPNLDSFSSLPARKLPFRVVVRTGRYATFTSSLIS